MKTASCQEETITLMSPKSLKKLELKENKTEEQDFAQRTALGKALHDLNHSEKVMNDLIFGRRVGLYELRGEIGSGNFSQVRLGIHDLTKGEILSAD